MTQKDNLLPWRTVLDNVALPLELGGMSEPERYEPPAQIITQVGLDGFEHNYSNELSGGMRKRVCLARMLIYGAETALLDEPFAALDAQLKLAMHDLLLRLCGAKPSRPSCLVTHDLMEAVTLADRVFVCTRRPAVIALEQRIDLKRPRDVHNVRFTTSSRSFTTRYGNACAWNTRRNGYERARCSAPRGAAARAVAAEGDRRRLHADL